MENRDLAPCLRDFLLQHDAIAIESAARPIARYRLCRLLRHTHRDKIADGFAAKIVKIHSHAGHHSLRLRAWCSQQRRYRHPSGINGGRHFADSGLHTRASPGLPEALNLIRPAASVHAKTNVRTIRSAPREFCSQEHARRGDDRNCAPVVFFRFSETKTLPRRGLRKSPSADLARPVSHFDTLPANTCCIFRSHERFYWRPPLPLISGRQPKSDRQAAARRLKSCNRQPRLPQGDKWKLVQACA